EEEEVSEKTTEDISSHQTHAFTINSPYKENANVQLPPKEETFDMHTTPRDTTDETGASFFSRLPKIPQSLLGLLHVPRVPQNRFFLVLIPVVLLLLFGLLAAYIFLLHANVTVVVSPKGVDQNADVVFSTENDSDFDSNTIHAKTTSISLSGNTSTQATGKKETGTKAKGTVTLFNSSDNKKQIQQGTVITSTNSLDFTLDKDVTIASATGDIFSGIKSGTSEVGVTAKQIGSEYNLPSNIKFSVGGNSSLAAKNEQAFSGGSKKNITVVAQADIDKLTSALPKSLIAKARDTLSEKITADETLLTVIPDFKPSKKDFSDNVAEEAKTVSLKSSVTFAAISYDNNDLLEFTKAFIKDKFDPNLTVADKDIQNTIKNVDQKDSSSVKASLSMKASLLPKIDTVSLSETLAGASFAKTRETLMRYPQVEDVQITLFPPLPLLPEILPRQKGNITIEITTNE
ncbi:MAG: baseplate J/gp47 family protein, partial [bacterium]|nr:baseplate J/gp47 family protein [bacterium]